jgi:hypothetical protein
MNICMCSSWNWDENNPKTFTRIPLELQNYEYTIPHTKLPDYPFSVSPLEVVGKQETVKKNDVDSMYSAHLPM